MKNKLAKIVLAVLGFAIVLFLSCADNSTLEYPSMDVFFPQSSGSEPNASSSSTGEQPDSSSSGGSSVSSSGDGSSVSSSGGGSSVSSSGGGSSVSSSGGGSSVSSSSNTLSVSSSSALSVSSSSSSSFKGSSSSSSPPLCGGATYDNTQFCYNGTTVLDRCGNTSSGATYDYATEACCGSGKYNKDTQFCYNNTQPYDKCNGNPFTPQTEDCCNDTKYTTANKYCYDNEVLDKKSCSGELYNDITHFCYSSSSVGEYCGINPQKSYNPANYKCNPNSNGIYLKDGVTDDGKNYKAVLIGTQVWMAENLNKNVSNTYNVVCSNSNCNDRLYTWAAAMDLTMSASDNQPNAYYYDFNFAYNVTNLINSPHKGICPENWHIPNNADWVTLMTYINKDCNSGSDNSNFKSCNLLGAKLRAKSWGNGTDDYGFAALPVGYTNMYQQTVDGAGKLSGWWNATENSYTYANNVNYMFIDEKVGDSLSVRNYSKSQKFSVRCVKDN